MGVAIQKTAWITTSPSVPRDDGRGNTYGNLKQKKLFFLTTQTHTVSALTATSRPANNSFEYVHVLMRHV